MSPKYRAFAHDKAHARRVEQATSVGGPQPKSGQRQCAICGRWLNNPNRAHRAADHVTPCREPRAVTLDELPAVELPATRSSAPKPEPTGVREWGTCETCGATVTGERRFCGLCLAHRMDDRGRR